MQLSKKSGAGCVAAMACLLACDLSVPESIDVAFEMSLEGYTPRDGSFYPLATPTIAREVFYTVPVDGDVLVVGGIDDRGNYVREVESYDPDTDTWSARASWEEPGLAWLSVIGDEVCMVGGYQDLDQPVRASVDCYDPASDTWRRGAPIPGSYTSLYPAVHDGKLYLLGGTAVEDTNPVAPVDWAQVYDPADDSWTDLAPLPAARGLMAAQTVAGKIYLVGGYSDATFADREGSPEEQEMLVYDPSNDTWDIAPAMPSARGLFGIDTVADRLVVFMGITDGPLAEVYDPATNTWTGSNDPAESIDAGVYSYVQHDDELVFLVIADEVGADGTDSSGKVWTYDPVGNAWAQTATRPATEDPTPLLSGVSLADTLYYVGALARITTREAPAPAGLRHGGIYRTRSGRGLHLE